MTDDDTLATALFAELFTSDQLARTRLSKALPKGMELSHFSVLNYLAQTGGEKSPAQLAKIFSLTRGAMTNTLNKLEWAGYVNVRPDWDDARRKLVTISPAGRTAREVALSDLSPLISHLVSEIGPERVRSTIPVLRELRRKLAEI
ncbi:MarR family transcriptional regulator [Alphaproteobacteria bacterium KMM 3653]|uniref:MarR family transcriptional regulator n=1 Tax=Harenicola maris TaxID=2841044 RepID=A0AAP2CU28_9RHOB|nr:MarR family transcriptional regulator [Harenicola maris]